MAKFKYQISLIKTSPDTGVVFVSEDKQIKKGTHIRFKWHMFAKIEVVEVLPPVQSVEGEEEYFDFFQR